MGSNPIISTTGRAGLKRILRAGSYNGDARGRVQRKLNASRFPNQDTGNAEADADEKLKNMGS